MILAAATVVSCGPKGTPQLGQDPDESQSAWVVDAGTYKFHIGASSRDIKATLEAGIKCSVRPANNVLNLQK